MKLKTKFQDEDFDLGEVIEANVYYGGNGRIKVIAEPAKGGIITFYFETLKGMNEMFEDAPDEKKFGGRVSKNGDEYWYISDRGDLESDKWVGDAADIAGFEMGIAFWTREEAEKELERRKAWTRLEDKGFRITGWTIDDGLKISICTNLNSDGIYDDYRKETKKDLDICFGGEE